MIKSVIMKMFDKKVKITAAILLCMTILLAGCGTKDSVLVTVGGTEITQNELTAFTNYYILRSELLPEDFTSEQRETLEMSLLTFMVEIEAEKVKYKAEGVTVIDNTTKSLLQTEVKSSMEELQASGEFDFKTYNISEDTVFYFLESSYYDAKFQEDVLAANPITDDEVQAYYEENISDYEMSDGTRTVDEVRTSIVLTLESKRVEDAYVTLRANTEILWSDLLEIDRTTNLAVGYAGAATDANAGAS